MWIEVGRSNQSGLAVSGLGWDKRMGDAPATSGAVLYGERRRYPRALAPPRIPSRRGPVPRANVAGAQDDGKGGGVSDWRQACSLKAMRPPDMREWPPRRMGIGASMAARVKSRRKGSRMSAQAPTSERKRSSRVASMPKWARRTGKERLMPVASMKK